jgi:hypothetical protein
MDKGYFIAHLPCTHICMGREREKKETKKMRDIKVFFETFMTTARMHQDILSQHYGAKK